MKKVLFALFLALTVLLSACQDTASPETDMSATEIAEYMFSAIVDETEATAAESSAIYSWEQVTLYSGEEMTEELKNFYGLSAEQWEDAATVRASGMSAFEITVIILPEGVDDEEVAAVREGAENYLISREGDFTGYAPEQAKLVNEGQILTHGRYLSLIIAEEQEELAGAFDACFDGSAELTDVSVPSTNLDSNDSSSAEESASGSDDTEESVSGSDDSGNSSGVVTYPGRYPYSDPKTDDMTLYDTSTILAAWKSGDRSGLSEKDTAILETAEQVLDDMLTDDMSDFYKEAALYFWVTDNLVYDDDHMNHFATMDPDSANPYGGLINHKAICLGFATTFQLLMDMADVECITVTGAAYSSTENHAWNMVRLDGEWYCVDTTWDAGSNYYFVPGKEDGVKMTKDTWQEVVADLDNMTWMYFNVTSDFLAEMEHQWDYSSVPEATSESRGK